MNFYLEKYGFCPPQIQAQVSKNLGLIVVIPAFNEPQLFETLECLNQCDRPKKEVEVIVVINASESTSADIKKQNSLTYEEAKEWAKTNEKVGVKFHFILNQNLPKKHAGVGLARKIGMDEAVYRFDLAKTDGLIINLDADTLCEPNYFTAIESHFENQPESPACSIYYEHPTQGKDYAPEVYEGIIRYELHLRYVRSGLEYAQSPFAFHTVGSAFACRSSVYQKQGGMNKRKAGEDFYFIQKMIQVGNYSHLIDTKVIPSPRPSNRAPFGTGQVINDWLNQDSSDFTTYDFRIFEALKTFNSSISDLYQTDLNQLNWYSDTNYQHLIDFFESREIQKNLNEMKRHSTNLKTFQKRFNYWYNGLMTIQLIHHLRDQQFPNNSLKKESVKLLEKLRLNRLNNELTSILDSYKRYERRR